MPRGKLILVGLGPGAPDQMTGRARQALAEAQVVVGYAKYLDLAGGLIAGKEVIRKGMTQEVDRCRAACQEARQGKTVALVSSGDSGVYGMAALAYELLLASGWRPGAEIDVEVVPGITALSACASLVGAPLGHDFCAISLSDLLTPWPVIARRLEAAARGDFVFALYNPSSGRRRGQLLAARAILLCQRRPDTPVAIVSDAYREGQAVALSTLDHLAACAVGMLSTVLIGNSNSFVAAGRMITPRGYDRKYAGLTGAVKAGERPGRSLDMGLAGFKACVRRHLDQAQGPGLEAVARHFDVPVAEILAAIAEAHGGAGGYAAEAVIPGREAEILQAARGWGRVRVGVESGNGARCELPIDGQDLDLRGDHLCLACGEARLAIDWRRVGHAWFLRHGRGQREAWFVDRAGDALCTLSLDPTDTDPIAHFERAWTHLAIARREP